MLENAVRVIGRQERVLNPVATLELNYRRPEIRPFMFEV